MGGCFKKPVRIDDQPAHVQQTLETQVQVADSVHQSNSHFSVIAPIKAPIKVEDPVEIPQSPHESPPRNPPQKYEIEGPSEPPSPKPLIQHYDNPEEMMKKYNLTPAEKKPEGKKRSMIVFAQQRVEIRKEEDEVSFESSASVV